MGTRRPSISCNTCCIFYGGGFLIGVALVGMFSDISATLPQKAEFSKSLIKASISALPETSWRSGLAEQLSKTPDSGLVDELSVQAPIANSDSVKVPIGMPSPVEEVRLVVMDPDCDEDNRGGSCDDVCGKERLSCDVDALKKLSSTEALEKATASVDYSCVRFITLHVPGPWDGPWADGGGGCGFSDHRDWMPSCHIKVNCGFQRICPCKGVLKAGATSPGRNFTEYRTGGALWPTGMPSKYEWSNAIGRIQKVPRRMMGVEENIFSAARPPGVPVCGHPCVVHCVAGQPRDLVNVPGMVKAMRYRLFAAMSEHAVVVAVLIASALMGNGGSEGDPGFVRSVTGSVTNKMLLPVLENLGVDRALILREKCSSINCIRKHAGFSCDGKALGLTAFVDRKSGKLHNICDVQFRRFQTCMHLVREYEQDHSVTAHWVTRQRPDVYWTQPCGPVSDIKPTSVYLHSWAACGYGGGDWFYAAPRKHADVIARFADEMTCERLQRDRILPRPCANCLGCECMLVAWLLSNGIQVAPIPWNTNSVSKFCGAGCPNDWQVTPENIARR